MDKIKKLIVDDLKRVASQLKCVPTREAYHRSGMGRFTEHQVKKHFETFQDAILAAGLSLEDEAKKVTDPAGLKLKELSEDLRRTREYVRELEEDAVSSSTLRDMIGVMNHQDLGQDSEWTKGVQKERSQVTGIPVLFLSDIHFDEVVRPEQIGGMNAYSNEIARARIEHTFKRTVELLKYHMVTPKYDGIVCALGGDLLSGNIHEELKETNEKSINRSLLELTDLLIAGIGLLADEFGKVFVPCVVGNHGRYDKKPRMKNRVYDNFEWLVYQYCARHFQKDDRVSFLIPDGADASFQIYDKRILLTHGDQFKGGAGIAGIFSPLMLGMARKQRRQQAVNQPFDILMMGHWHQLIMTEQLMINGSIKGYDEFAYLMNFPYEPPQQALFIVHPEKALSFRMPILCDGFKRWRKAASQPKLVW